MIWTMSSSEFLNFLLADVILLYMYVVRDTRVEL